MSLQCSRIRRVAGLLCFLIVIPQPCAPGRTIKTLHRCTMQSALRPEIRATLQVCAYRRGPTLRRAPRAPGSPAHQRRLRNFAARHRFLQSADEVVHLLEAQRGLKRHRCNCSFRRPGELRGAGRWLMCTKRAALNCRHGSRNSPQLLGRPQGPPLKYTRLWRTLGRRQYSNPVRVSGRARRGILFGLGLRCWFSFSRIRASQDT